MIGIGSTSLNHGGVTVIPRTGGGRVKVD